MRPTAWVSFLALFLLTAAVSNSVSTAHARPAPAAQSPERPPSWVVQGDWMTTDDEAVQDALDKARAKLTEYLRAQTPPMTWSVDRTWVQQKLWRDLKADDPAFKALDWDNLKEKEVLESRAEEKNISGHTVQLQTGQFKGLGEMRRAALRVEISQFARNEIQEQERQHQAKLRQDRAAARQGVLVRVLAGLVALLAVIAAYLRLEDATKGYYTTLLRLAAVTFVVLVGAGIWLLT
jgi:hypothetical protein